MRYLILPCLLILSACGFTPMYGNTGGSNGVVVESALSTIKIDNIPDREGQILRNMLIDRFYRNGRPSGQDVRYALSVNPIRESIRDLDITVTSDATRGQLRLDTTFTLTDARTKKDVLTRNIRAISSFNILASEFTNRVSEQNARENTLRDLAGQIERQLNLYFKRQ